MIEQKIAILRAHVLSKQNIELAQLRFEAKFRKNFSSMASMASLESIDSDSGSSSKSDSDQEEDLCSLVQERK